MKKNTIILVLLFSIAFVNAQSSCATALTVTLNSTTTAPAFTAETGTLPTLFCGIGNGNGTPGNATATKGKWYKFIATQNIDVTVSTLLPQNNNFQIFRFFNLSKIYNIYNFGHIFQFKLIRSIQNI